MFYTLKINRKYNIKKKIKLSNNYRKKIKHNFDFFLIPK